MTATASWMEWKVRSLLTSCRTPHLSRDCNTRSGVAKKRELSGSETAWVAHVLAEKYMFGTTMMNIFLQSVVMKFLL